MTQMPTDRGIFISIEGVEGVGKSTAVKFIQKFLSQKHIDFILTREPGGTEIAEQIRQILLTHHAHEPLLPLTELLLMFASRYQHVETVIKPALAAKKWVISDRFVDASYAYQGGGRQIDAYKIAELDKWIVQAVNPDVTILLDAPPELGFARAKGRGQSDRIESEKIDFFSRVREAYIKRANAYPDRFHIIDATQSISQVEQQIESLLHKFIMI